MRNFITRTLTGGAYVALILAGLLINEYLYLLIFLPIMLAALNEFYTFSALSHTQPQKYYGSVIGAYLFLAAFVWHKVDGGSYFTLLVLPMLLFVFIFELYRGLKRPLLNISTTILGLIYIALPFVLMTHLTYYSGEFNGHILLGLFILIWVNDTGAYLTGMTFGRNRLFERISPKKTWEGFIGGLIISLASAYLLFKIINSLELIQWLIVAFLVVIFGTLGDLSESLFKRSLNLKDSGKILPGHGGMLDRFDSLVIAVPIIFTYLYFFVK